ncbi:MAG: ABC transporter substrate-binding protein [Fusobacteriaceae bacterium]|jgi:branched-chain amino acid transport system substrate-binding protein|nr:ABC transporter substrate-binding protein [Fusobacteriaceae bacterium]
MMKRFYSFLMVVFVLLVGLTFSTKAKASKAEEGIPIGIIAPTTGGVAVYGQAVVNGLKLAIEEINAKGGVLGGKKLIPTYLDDKGDAVEGINSYNKLTGDKVKAIIGPVTSGVVSGVAEKANKEGMIILTPSGTADSLTIGKPTVFRTCFTDSYQGRIIAKFAATKLNIKKAAVLYCGADEYSLGLFTAFQDACKEFGIEIVAKETSASMEDIDFSAQLGNIAVTDAEALFVPMYYGTVALLAPQARHAGFDKILLGSDGWGGIGDKMGDNEEYFNNSFFTSHFSSEDKAEEVQNFVKNYTAKYGKESLNEFSALGYDSAYVLAQAINEAGSDETAKIAEAMSKMTFKGVTGRFNFDKNGDPVKGAPIIELKDGELKWNSTVE